MSVISLLNVDIKDKAASFSDPFKFEITFECLEPLAKDLEWKLVYVGSATSSEHDQELESLLVGPIPVGVNKFEFVADPPNASRIPSSEILGSTVILLVGAYDTREFIRVGYYIHNEYDNEEMNADPPKQVQLERIRRNILAEKPRVTRFAIKWDSEESAPAEFPPDQPEADLQPADGEQYGAEEEEEESEAEAEGEAGAEAAPKDPDAMEEDTEMGDSGAAATGEVEAAGDESEDLEGESSEEEYDEEEEGEEGEDEEMGESSKQGDDAMHTDTAPGGAGQQPPVQQVAAHQ